MEVWKPARNLTVGVRAPYGRALGPWYAWFGRVNACMPAVWATCVVSRDEGRWFAMHLQLNSCLVGGQPIASYSLMGM